MIKLVAFDWNGTILSDTNAVLRSENETRQHFGLKLSSLKQFQQEYSIPIKNYWLTTGLTLQQFEEKAEEIAKKFMSSYEPREKLCKTRSGTKSILQFLKEKNIQIVIFSNHPTEHIRIQAKRLGINDYFSEILGRDAQNSHMHLRSKEDKIVNWVQSRNIKPEDVLVVGDTDEEIEIGIKHGFHTVALTGGFQSTARLKAAEPNYLINSLFQLKDIILKN